MNNVFEKLVLDETLCSTDCAKKKLGGKQKNDIFLGYKHV
jgi:hypothetical protein